MKHVGLLSETLSEPSPQPSPLAMRFVLLLVAFLVGLAAYVVSAGSFLSFSKAWGTTGPSIAGDFHGAEYELNAHSMELLDDGSTALVWTTATFPGGPQGLAYVVMVKGLDWDGTSGWSTTHSSRAESHDQGLLAELQLAGGGAAISLAYAVDMVPPGADRPRGAVVCEERLLGGFTLGSVHVPADQPMDLGSGRVFVAQVSEEGIALDQLDVDLSLLGGGEFTADELHDRIVGDGSR